MRPLALALALALALVMGLATASSTVFVDSSDLGYTPPIVAIASGDSVVWRSSDNFHSTADEAGIAGAEQCFFALHTPDEESAPVRFDVRDGALFAFWDDTEYECGNAIDGGSAFVLPFFCQLHPTMRGALVVSQ